MSAARMSWRPGRAGLRWLFSRRGAKALVWAVLVLACAVGANIAGIYLVGSIAGWERWLAAASGYFLVWRLCLYGATAYGWVWMRRRLLAREANGEMGSKAEHQARRRLIRAEVAGVAAIAILEASLLVHGA